MTELTERQKARKLKEIADKIATQDKAIQGWLNDLGKLYFENPPAQPDEVYANLYKLISTAKESIVDLNWQINTLSGIKVCTKCGARISSADSYCGKCGAVLPEDYDFSKESEKKEAPQQVNPVKTKKAKRLVKESFVFEE